MHTFVILPKSIIINVSFAEVDELQEGDKVRESQERLLQCLQAYTLARCPESPSKFGELLLKIPELQRICQVSCFCFRILDALTLFLNLGSLNNFF